MAIVKRLVVAGVKREGRMSKQNTQDFLGNESTLYDTVMVENVIIYLSKPTEHTAPTVNPNVNCRLCVALMCQSRVIDCNKGTTLVLGC